MPFCPNCGAQYDEGVRFCPSCGTPLGHGASDQSTQSSSAPEHEYSAPVYTNAAPSGTPFVNDRTMAIIAVVFPLLFFLPLVAGEKSEFGTFWANQALLLLILAVLSEALVFIIIGFVTGVFAFVCWIISIIAVCNSQMKPLPLIGGITIIK